MSKFNDPTILVFSGFDPSGGAGIQADIETIGALGGHAVPVMTVNTVQNTQNVDALCATPIRFFQQQIQKIREDIPFAAIKIGLLGDLAITRSILSFIREHSDIPVILDPILMSGAGDRMSNSALVSLMKDELLPRVTLITPNSIEARRLTQINHTLDQCGRELIELGCPYVLITGTHEEDQNVNHRLYSTENRVTRLTCERLSASFHGSGCTLAAAISYFCTQHISIPEAIEPALTYTWNTLKFSKRIGQGQRIPNRYFMFDAQ